MTDSNNSGDARDPIGPTLRPGPLVLDLFLVMTWIYMLFTGQLVAAVFALVFLAIAVWLQHRNGGFFEDE